MLRRDLKVKWRCATRADCVSKELIKLMRRSGCVRISYGIESGSPRILKNIHKMVDMEQIENACRWAKESGMIIEACFMVGNVGETQETIDETKKLIKRIQVDEYCVSNAVYIFPGTPIFRLAEKQGLVDDKVWLSKEQVIPYTGEHTLQQLSKWQMELIRECGISQGFFHYLLYAIRVARRLPFRVLLKSGFYFIKANFTPLLLKLVGKRS